MAESSEVLDAAVEVTSTRSELAAPIVVPGEDDGSRSGAPDHASYIRNTP